MHAQVQYRHSDAVVLHYPCCSHEVLWARWKRGNDNYRLRGAEHPPPLHAHVGAAAQAAFARGGAEAAERRVEELFAEKVMLRDPAEADFQQRAGVCVRVRAPSRVLAEAASAEPSGGQRRERE